MAESELPESFRFLIVAYHYPPSEAIGGRRPYALARLAAGANTEVKVLSSGDSCLPPVPGQDNLVDVICVPDPGMPGFNKASAAAVSSSNKRDAGKSAKSLILSWAKYLAREVLFTPDAQVSWIRPALNHYNSITTEWKPQVVLATGPPFSSFIVALMIARRYNAQLMLDYRDLWTTGNEYWGFGKSRVRRRIDRVMEHSIVRRSSARVTVSEPTANALDRTFGGRSFVAMNGIDERPADSSCDPKVQPDPEHHQGQLPLRLVHTGVLYPGKRDPRPVFEAMRMIDDDYVRVTLVGPNVDEAREAARTAGVVDRVDFVAEVSTEESWRIQEEADVLLLLMWNDVRDAGTVPGKFFDYLATRRTILMVGNQHGVVADMIGSRNLGAVLSDPEQIAKQMLRWIAIKKQTGSLPRLPMSVQDGLTRKEQLMPLIREIRTLANRPVDKTQGLRQVNSINCS
jgi:hypothetical protein